MSIRNRKLIIATLCGGLAALSVTASAQNSTVGSTTAVIESGKLQGASEDGVVSFQGIPYAAPPVSNLRWRAPQPVAPWNGTRSATSMAANCIQADKPGKKDKSGEFSEDCLYLNVWRPATPAQKLPVMVWIHGGGFVDGVAPNHGVPYAKHGVIMVSFSYRLGRFGFFAHPGLTAESPNGMLGNYGLLDQIAALKWVQRNIASFGGDPGNVTIFGESAGGQSVQMMLVSPLTKGLFQRVICESGGGGPSIFPELVEPSFGEAEADGVRFAAKSGINSTDKDALAKLRALPVESLRVLKLKEPPAPGTAIYSGPMIDGRILTGLPDDIYRKGGGWPVSLLIGATDKDRGLNGPRTADQVKKFFGEQTEKAMALYNPDGKDERDALSQIGTDYEMTEPSRYAARMYAARGLPAYEFRFSYVPAAERAKVKGAKHGAEVGYVFGGRGSHLTPADQALADTMVGYWTNFGKTGDPNGDGLPVWPKYSAATDMLMNFSDNGPVVEKDPLKARLDLIEAVENHL